MRVLCRRQPDGGAKRSVRRSVSRLRTLGVLKLEDAGMSARTMLAMVASHGQGMDPIAITHSGSPPLDAAEHITDAHKSVQTIVGGQTRSHAHRCQPRRGDNRSTPSARTRDTTIGLVGCPAPAACFNQRGDARQGSEGQTRTIAPLDVDQSQAFLAAAGAHRLGALFSVALAVVCASGNPPASGGTMST